MANPPAAPLPLRTLTLLPREQGAPNPIVTLARLGESLVLAHSTKQDLDSPLWAILSVMVNQDPFPGYSIEGNECFWIKTYSENDGILPQLEKAGWLRVTGRTIKQGFVEFPMVEVRLDESEMSHQCPTCGDFELPSDETRFQRCGKCKKRYYCSVEHQHEDWKEQHKRECKDLAKGLLAQVENRKRQGTTNFLAGAGFQVV